MKAFDVVINFVDEDVYLIFVEGRKQEFYVNECDKDVFNIRGELPSGSLTIIVSSETLALPSPTCRSHAANCSACKRSISVMPCALASTLIFVVRCRTTTLFQKGLWVIVAAIICGREAFGTTGRHCRKSPTALFQGACGEGQCTCEDHRDAAKPICILANVLQCSVYCFKAVATLCWCFIPYNEPGDYKQFGKVALLRHVTNAF